MKASVKGVHLGESHVVGWPAGVGRGTALELQSRHLWGRLWS